MDNLTQDYIESMIEGENIFIKQIRLPHYKVTS